LRRKELLILGISVNANGERKRLQEDISSFMELKYQQTKFKRLLTNLIYTLIPKSAF